MVLRIKEARRVHKFDKMARKYIKILHLKNSPEQCFYDELAHFILMWDKKQYHCKVITENIEDFNFCNGECKECEHYGVTD